ncbi:hypothetical protein NESM_000221100 [Novymonas esmeraldas]|uniref:Uncharacterized protein n=1 Tax=Novymonas esmeraldas TaxID=1808958 RepID=A0AAW0FAY0_9TRYP
MYWPVMSATGAPEALPSTATAYAYTYAATEAPPGMQIYGPAPPAHASNTHTPLRAPLHQTLVSTSAGHPASAAHPMQTMVDASGNMYVVNAPGASVPVRYVSQPLPATSSMPLVMSHSGLYTMGGGAPVTVLAPGSVHRGSPSTSLSVTSEDGARSYPCYATPVPTMTPCFAGAVPYYAPSNTFVMQTMHAPTHPPPQYGAVATPYSSITGDTGRSYPAPVVRNGDAGKGYEAGVYYEGRVKRFNPIRGYGFVSATHKLLPLSEYTAMKVAEAAAATEPATKAGGDGTASAAKQPKTAEGKASKRAAAGGGGTAKDGKAAKEATRGATTAIASGSGDGESALPVEVKADDVVYIKGAPYVRHPVTMGDIFVHYHCLQRNPGDTETETSGGLVNLPAGSRVQFKAEVFVPAELMETATDNKEAATMLNSLGVPVREDPNLLSGAIPTKKGWGYQAIDVHLLPARGTLPSQMGPLNSTAATATAAASASAAASVAAAAAAAKAARVDDTTATSVSSCSLNSMQPRREPTTPPTSGVRGSPAKEGSGDRGHAAPGPGATQPVRIHIPAERINMPPPPSFEAATASMPYTVTPMFGGVATTNPPHYMTTFPQ